MYRAESVYAGGLVVTDRREEDLRGGRHRPGKGTEDHVGAFQGHIASRDGERQLIFFGDATPGHVRRARRPSPSSIEASSFLLSVDPVAVELDPEDPAQRHRASRRRCGGREYGWAMGESTGSTGVDFFPI